MTTITLVIGGGELFQRNAVISEIAALLQSVGIATDLPVMLPLLDYDEHQDHVQHVANNCTIHIRHQ